MNEFDNNKKLEALLEEAAEQVQPNLVFKAELEEKLRKAHKPRVAIRFPRFNSLASALTGAAVLGALVFFMLWIFQSIEPQNNFGNEGFVCPITEPNGSLPPGETVESPEYLGNGELWTVLWPDGKVIMEAHNMEADGSFSMKWGFYRGVTGALTVEGRRLDMDAEPLRAEIPEGYGDTGFQVTGLIFPTTGCWEVTARAGESSLTFVTEVIYNEDGAPTPGVIIDPNATPGNESVGGYDYHGGKLFLTELLPESPASANVYTYIEDQPATLEEARALADRFGLDGEIYTTTFPQFPDKTGYIISDGKRMLTVYTANYFTYSADILVTNRGFYGASNDNAKAIITEFFEANGLDFPFRISDSNSNGMYWIHQLSPDGLPMRFDTFAMQVVSVTIGKNRKVTSMEANLMSYNPAAIGNYGIISAEEALNALLEGSDSIGMMETGSSSDGEPPQQWHREYPDNQTAAISGSITKYESAIAGQSPLILINGIPVIGNTGELETLEAYTFVQLTGQFVVEDGLRKFSVETLNTEVSQGFVSGTLRSAGDQIILSSDDGSHEYALLDPPTDLPLNTEIGKSYLGISGVITDGTMDWSSIQYFADASNMGGGGGGGGSGFYQLNLTGTPVPFPTQIPSEETYSPSELAGFLKYTVEEADTLESIASKFDVPLEDLMRVNYITDPNVIETGRTLVIPGVQSSTRVEGETGLLQINVYDKPDGRKRIQYLFVSQKDGMYYELKGEDLEPFQEIVNRPVTIWGDISYDEAGSAFLDVEKFEIRYPDLQFQILKGKQQLQEINGTPVMLFTSEGVTYVILSPTGLYPDLNYGGDFPEDISIEALIIPDETYEGYPALRVFNYAPALNPNTNEPFELTVMADKIRSIPDPYGNEDTYTQPDFIIDSVELEYYAMDPKMMYDTSDISADGQYIQPVWHFRGHYTNGAITDILVQALKQEFLSPVTSPLPQGG
ncbi:MAG: LysM peptidoglycan-binding domain-containing protein [Chloroflexi bacterium]|nr:LysM peptidoglycan-binding domain-containing protein [Chloroflexota bacterium]